MISYNEVSIYPFVLTIILSIVVALPFLVASYISRDYKHPLRLRADLASFSSGIFLGTVTFSIIGEATKLGDIFSMGIGFGIGAVTFSLTRYKIQHNSQNDPSEKIEGIVNSTQKIKENTNVNSNDKIKKSHTNGSGKLIIIGTLADSHPETIMIGIIIALGIPGLIPACIALFIGNFTATVVGTRELINEGEGKTKVLRDWFKVFLFVSVGGPIGYVLTIFLGDYYLSIIFGFAAGALISFVTEELIPDAYKKVNWHIGLSAAFGLFVSFAIYHFL